MSAAEECPDTGCGHSGDCGLLADVVTNPPRSGSRRFERVRRPFDLLLASLALGVVVVTLGLIRALPIGSTEVSNDVSRFLVHLPRWLCLGAAVVAAIGGFVFIVVTLVALVRSEARGAVNAGLAAIAAAVAAIVASAIWHGEHGSVAHAVLHGKNPTTFVVDTAYLAFVVGSDLARRSRWWRWCVLSGGGLVVTGLAIDSLTPFALVVSLFAALFFGWTTRWLLGAASVRPGTDELVAWLSASQVFVGELDATDHQRLGRLEGSLADGRQIEVRMANRDTRGLGLLRRLWALVRFHPLVAGHLTLSSRLRTQQLALSSYIANSAGVLSPSVLLLAEMPPETLVLVLATPPGERLSKDSGPEVASDVFAALRALHDAGVAHRDLRAENIIVSKRSAGFSSLDSALPGAGELVRRLDVTQLLTTLSSYVGAERAVQALRSAYRPQDEAADRGNASTGRTGTLGMVGNATSPGVLGRGPPRACRNR